MPNTILLVEDNADDEFLMLRAFKQNRIVNNVAIAHDGVEALDYLFGTGVHAGRDTSEQPQIIFLDLQLPKLDGLEVLKRLRADERTKLIPVVVLTTSTEEGDIVRSYELGVNSFVQKVTDFKDFVEIVKQLGLYWLLLNKTASAH